jgi:hypothetical protein
MLFHSDGQGDVVVFGPAAQWMEQEDWLLVTSIQQGLTGVLHEKSVAVMDRISQLERENSIGSHVKEFSLEFGGR